MMLFRQLLKQRKDAAIILRSWRNFHGSTTFGTEFKSPYSLDRIYPNSSLNIAKSPEVPSNEKEFSGYIPVDLLDITYSRSSGPGGQHANKVNTKVEVRFHVNKASWIPQKVKESFTQLHQNNITKGGFFIVKSEKTRMQSLNLADCLDKIRCYLREASKPPPENLPETLALLKKRADKVASERLKEKRYKAEIKRFKNEGLDCPNI